MILKVDCKILVSFGFIKNLKILDSAMATVEKVNIAVTFMKLTKCLRQVKNKSNLLLKTFGTKIYNYNYLYFMQTKSVKKNY